MATFVQFWGPSNGRAGNVFVGVDKSLSTSTGNDTTFLPYTYPPYGPIDNTLFDPAPYAPSLMLTTIMTTGVTTSVSDNATGAHIKVASVTDPNGAELSLWYKMADWGDFSGTITVQATTTPGYGTCVSAVWYKGAYWPGPIIGGGIPALPPKVLVDNVNTFSKGLSTTWQSHVQADADGGGVEPTTFTVWITANSEGRWNIGDLGTGDAPGIFGTPIQEYPPDGIQVDGKGVTALSWWQNIQWGARSGSGYFTDTGGFSVSARSASIAFSFWNPVSFYPPPPPTIAGSSGGPGGSGPGTIIRNQRALRPARGRTSASAISANKAVVAVAPTPIPILKATVATVLSPATNLILSDTVLTSLTPVESLVTGLDVIDEKCT